MLTVESGDEIVVEMATHHACDDYDKMIKGDEGMNHGRKELIRLVKSLEAQKDPRRQQDFDSLPVSLMVRLTLQRIIKGAIGRVRRLLKP